MIKQIVRFFAWLDSLTPVARENRDIKQRGFHRIRQFDKEAFVIDKYLGHGGWYGTTRTGAYTLREDDILIYRFKEDAVHAARAFDERWERVVDDEIIRLREYDNLFHRTEYVCEPTNKLDTDWAYYVQAVNNILGKQDTVA